jgi:hypothetical protein
VGSVDEAVALLVGVAVGVATVEHEEPPPLEALDDGSRSSLAAST